MALAKISRDGWRTPPPRTERWLEIMISEGGIGLLLQNPARLIPWFWARALNLIGKSSFSSDQAH